MTPVFTKRVNDNIVFTFDFSYRMIFSTIESAVVTAVMDRGTKDPNPQDTVFGEPVIEGKKVMQRIRGGREGAIYRYTCTATDTNGERWSDQILIWTKVRIV